MGSCSILVSSITKLLATYGSDTKLYLTSEDFNILHRCYATKDWRLDGTSTNR